jgi:dihydrofolate synthase/folylpolyglutamate synthase
MTYHSGIKPGLDRVQDLAALVGNPHERLSVIHVAGTNGKGSTSAMLASILQCAGYNVGLYTSPHIRRFNERMRINGIMIDDDDVARLASPLMEHAKQIGGTFFEVTTAMAFQWFAERRVDVAVIETGLGGRLDATNIVRPMLSVITYIDVDHTEYLGSSVTGIAREKAGIIKQGARAVVGPQVRAAESAGNGSVDAEIRAVFSERAAEVGTEVVFADEAVRVEVDAIHPDLTMSVSVIDDEVLRYYDVDLAGRHQARNVATVLTAVPAFNDVLFVDAEHVREGLASIHARTGLDGRVQRVATHPTVILDVSHNPSGIRSLRETLLDAGYPHHSWHVVFGAMRDKDILGMLSELHPLVSTLHLCQPTIPRAATVEALDQIARTLNYPRIITHTSVATATERAIMRGPTIICGSFHVAEEATQTLSAQ